MLKQACNFDNGEDIGLNAWQAKVQQTKWAI